MTLRSSYLSSLDAKLLQAKAAGSDWVSVTNLALITSGLVEASNKGKKSFTVNIPVTYQPDDLKLLGPLWEAFKSGIFMALITENIMMNEVSASLNTASNLSISIDLKFTF